MVVREVPHLLACLAPSRFPVRRRHGAAGGMVYSSKEKGVAMSPFVWLGVAAVMGVVEGL